MKNEKIFEPRKYGVYAKVNDNSLVCEIFSDCFKSPDESDVLIKQGIGDEYVHVGYYELYNVDRTHKYKISDGEMVECTPEDTARELSTFPEPKPTANERMDDIELYMTDILYEISLSQFEDINL